MLEVFKYLLHSNGQIQHFDCKIVFILWTSLIPAKVPVPTPAGPIQLNVGEGDLIFFAWISVNLLLEEYNCPLLTGEL